MAIDYEKYITYNKLSDMEVTPYWITVLYSEFGKRKTTTACSMIKEKGLLVTADNSWRVLLKPIHMDLFEKVTIVTYESRSQLLHIDYSKFDTIIFDTFSKMVAMYLDLLFDKANWGGKYRDKLVLARGLSELERADLEGTEKNAPADYMVLRDKFRPVLDRVFKTEAHKIFTSHVTNPIQGLSTDLTKRPSIPDKTFQIVGEAADVIGYLEGSGKKGITVNVDENAAYCVGKSRIQGIEGKMDWGMFISTYKENI